MFRAKLKAMLLHGLVSLFVAVVLSVLVFYWWYPQVFSQVMPGAKLFVLVLAVEVVLGPFMSFVIYNPLKPRRELIIDYGVIVAIQLMALGYGVFSVANSRPVYVVFVKDRLEVVATAEVSRNDMQEVSDVQFKSLPWFGPKFICVKSVSDAQERERLLFEDYTKGKDVQHLPRFYRNCEKNEIYEEANGIKKLLSVVKARNNEILFGNLLTNKDLKWLPLHGKQGIWIAFLRQGQDQPVEFIKFDPY